MGQKSSRLDLQEDWLAPHGQHRSTDLRKLKLLIKQGRVAPCYKPYEEDDWASKELEECPICFLAYPALNRSKCCSKEICTECFLQVKLPNGNRNSVPCPFCKCPFSVIFKGPRTALERIAAREEELRVLAATQRARQAEGRGFEGLSQLIPEPASKDHEKIKLSDQKIRLERAATDPVTQPDGPVSTSRAPRRRRRTSSTDEDIMQAILLSLQLRDQLAVNTTAPSTAEQEQDMLQQAIRASLADQPHGIAEPPSPCGSVRPNAVALSPMPSRSLSTPPLGEPSFTPAESSIRSQRSGHVDPRQNHTLEHRASRQLSFSRLRPDPLERQAVVMDSRSPEVASQCSAGLALMPVETHGRLPTTPRALSPEHNTVLESKSTTLQARKQPVEFSELERDVQDLEARAQRYQERQQRTEKVELHSSYQLEPQDQALREFGQRTSEQALSLDERVDEKVEVRAPQDCTEVTGSEADNSGEKLAAHIRMRSCGPLEAHRLSLSLQASIPEKEQRRASTLAGPLEENFLSTAIPARGLRLPNLPARGQYDQRVSQAHTYDRYENEHSKSIAEGSSSTRDEASHSFSTLPDDSSYCSSPQFVYSSAGSLFTPSSVSGTTAVSSSRDDLIPAVWSPSFSNQQISSRSPKVSRYLPQLRAELIGNDIPSPTPAQKSPDDDAWKEFKQSLLGSDWMHGRRSSFAQTSQQHQPEYSDTDVQQRQTGELDLNASFDRTDLGQSSSEVLNFSGCSPALSSVYDSDMENDKALCQTLAKDGAHSEPETIAAHYGAIKAFKLVQDKPRRKRRAQVATKDMQTNQGRKSLSFADLVHGKGSNMAQSSTIPSQLDLQNDDYWPSKEPIESSVPLDDKRCQRLTNIDEIEQMASA